MRITLKNGETVDLIWSAIVLEYLEDYEGGIKQLQKDIEEQNGNFRTFNFVIYSMLSAVYPKRLSYREAVGLVDINDYDKIITFIVQNVSALKSTNIIKKTSEGTEKFHII